MKYIHNKHIDKVKWDELVFSSTNPRIYMLSWYLDITCPGWYAFVWNDYEAGFPVFVKSIVFFKYVPPPLLSQQTGLFFRKGFDFRSALKEAFSSLTVKLMLRFNVNFHSQLTSSELGILDSNNLLVRKNYILDISRTYVDLASNYNDNRRRNLKKAVAQGWTCQSSENIDDAIEMYKTFQGFGQKGLANIYDILKGIFLECKKRDMAELYCCKSQEDEVLAFCFFARFENRIYYLFGSMNDAGKKNSAMSVIFDFVIKKYSGNNLILDFEGGNSPGIGNYFSSFGAIPEEYIAYKKNLI